MNEPRVENRDRKRIAVLFSAALFPGAGQFIQKRWVPGVLFLGAFLVGFIVFLGQTLYPMFSNLWIAADGFEENLQVMDLPRILLSFGFCALVYVIGLIDTCRANASSR